MSSYAEATRAASEMIADRDAEIRRLRGVIEEIRNAAFYHMTRHADERGDRKVLGEIKERAIAALKE